MLHPTRFALAFLLLNLVVPMRVGALQQFYGIDDIAASRSVDAKLVGELNKQNKEIGWKGSSLKPAAMLHGGNSISITVIDEQTSKPVPAYVIHGVVLGRSAIPDDRDEPHSIYEFGGQSEKKKYTKFFEQIVGIGRLESKKIHDPAGKCTYADLGSLEVEFQACAEGYVTRGEVVKIPDDGTSLTIKLMQSGTISGRVLGVDGSPAKGIQVQVSYRGGDKGMHTGYNYWIRTDEDGQFVMAGLPPDDYSAYFPEFPLRNTDIETSIQKRVRAEQENSGREWSRDEINRRRDELSSETLLVPPPTSQIHLTPGSRIDLGTLRIKKAPVVEVRIVGPDGSPMANYPFEIQLGYESIRSKTDTAGNAQVAIAGCNKPTEAILFSPEALKEQYQPKRFKAAPPESTNDRSTDLLTLSDKDYFNKHRSYVSVPIIDDQPPPQKYDELAAGQKEEVHRQVEKEREQLRAWKAAMEARPDHPNYQVFTAQPGETSKVVLIYKQPGGAMNPRLLIRDRATGKPVPQFRGIVVMDRSADRELIAFDMQLKQINQYNKIDSRFFQSADPTGRVTLTGLTLPESLTRQLTPAYAPTSSEPPLPPIHVVIDAPGYARQMFDFTTIQMRSPDELVFDLEPEACIIGRVVIAETGEPLNKQTLKALLERKKQWKEKYASSLEYENPSVLMTNSYLDGKYVPSGRQHFSIIGRGRIGDDGRFEIHSIRPGENWGLKIEIEGVPEITRTLTLKPGANDLGEFKIGGEGILTVNVSDEQGKPLPGAYLKWPLGVDFKYDPTVLESVDVKEKRENPETDAAGMIVFPMNPLKSDRQIVRLIPPWGLKDNEPRPGRNYGRIMFDAVMDLDRTAEKKIDAHLVRGHRLVITLPASPQRDELIRAAIAEHKLDYRGKPQQTFFGIACVYLQSTKPNAQGFVYEQCFVPEGGVEVTTRSATTTINVEDVPPGRYYLCVEGVAFVPPIHPEYADTKDTAKRRAYRHTADTEAARVGVGAPMTMIEFDMPDRETSVSIELNNATVEIALENPEALPLRDAVVLMDRTEPLTWIFGGDVQRTLADAVANRGFARQIENLTIPMVGFYDGFIEQERSRRTTYRPAVFRGVPPGTYNIQVYANVNDALAKPPKEVFKKTIVVGRNCGRVQVSVPR